MGRIGNRTDRIAHGHLEGLPAVAERNDRRGIGGARRSRNGYAIFTPLVLERPRTAGNYAEGSRSPDRNRLARWLGGNGDDLGRLRSRLRTAAALGAAAEKRSSDPDGEKPAGNCLPRQESRFTSFDLWRTGTVATATNREPLGEHGTSLLSPLSPYDLSLTPWPNRRPILRSAVAHPR